MSIVGQQSTRRIEASPRAEDAESDVAGASGQTECEICPLRNGEKGGQRSVRSVFLHGKNQRFQ